METNKTGFWNSSLVSLGKAEKISSQSFIGCFHKAVISQGL